MAQKGPVNDFRIVVAKSAAELTEEVKRLMRDGWSYTHGHAIAVGPNGLTLTQILVKYAPGIPGPAKTPRKAHNYDPAQYTA